MLRTTVFILCTIFHSSVFAVITIKLPYETPNEVHWTTPEREYFAKQWGGNAITNVSEPEMLMYQPSAEKNNGTSVILAPGGGIYALSIGQEGYNVAKYLTNKGVTVFILKYRLVPTGKDGIEDLINIVKKDNNERIRITKKVLPYSVSDGLNAVSYIRDNAKNLNVSPDKIGFMGFSGGGVILFGVVNQSSESNQPNFYVPVYPGTDLITPKPTNNTSPTLFIVAANDQLIDAPHFTELFNQWHKAGVKTGMHIFSQGGHGFGTWKQNLPVDNWLDRFYEWAVGEKLIQPK